ncbi:MAG TPA: hypothetical protein VF406_05595 [Thermodesulfobacteriota bacterium]
MTNEVEVIATVEAIDRDQRVVTMRGPQGRVVDVKVPPEAQNLDQVEVGDRIRVRYLEGLAIMVEPAGGGPSASQSGTVRLAPKGATPGGVAVQVRQIRARVDAVDHAQRTVTLTGPQGRTVTLPVDPSVERFDQVKPGDEVVVAYAESLALSLVKE